MNQKYNQEFINTIIEKYNRGQPVALLCTKYELSRSTVYAWLRKYKKLKAKHDQELNYQDYYLLKKRYDKLEKKLQIIKAVGCGLAAPLQEKLQAMEKLYGQYSVRVLCETLEVSRGTFYNHIFRRKKIKQNDIRREEIRILVRDVFDEYKQRIGAKKICVILAERGVRTSSGYVSGLMQEMGLQSIGRHSKKEYFKQLALHKRSNKLRQQFHVEEPNHVWISDTTYFRVKEKHYYICMIMDLFSRKILAHKISQKHSTYLITATFKQAFAERNHPKQLLFHSDQGTQYTSKTFRNLLHVNNVEQSFSRSGQPHDNAVAESFFSALKKEELYRINFRSEREFYECVNNYIHYYNTKRPHETLSYQTPDQFEEAYYKRNV